MSSTPTPAAGGAPMSYLGLFKIKEFRRYWISQMVSSIGDRLDQMAVMALILRSNTIPESEKGSAAILIFLFATLPYVLVTPLAAGLPDRVDRKKLMIGTDIYRGLVVAFAATLYSANFEIIWLYYLCVFLSGCGTAIFGPCKLAFIPQAAPARGIVKANSISSMTGTLGTLIGGAAGGFFVVMVAGALIPITDLASWAETATAAEQAAYFDSATRAARWLLWIDAATFAFSAWMLWRIAMPKGNLPYYLNDRIRQAGGEDKIDGDLRELVDAASARSTKPYFSDLADAVRYCMRHAIGRRQLGLTALVWLIVGVAYSGFNLRAVNVLSANEDNLGRVFGALGVAMFAGGLVIGLGQRWFKPRRVTTGAMLLLAATAPLPLLAGEWWHLLFLCFPTGMVAGVVIIAIDSVYQLTIPNRLRGRMFALNYIVVNIALVLGMGLVLVLKAVLDAGGEEVAKNSPATASAWAFYSISILALIGAAMVWLGAVHLMGLRHAGLSGAKEAASASGASKKPNKEASGQGAKASKGAKKPKKAKKKE